MSAPTPTRKAWLDRFFASYYAARPVNATFIGEHDGDGQLPDFSENGAGDALAEMEELVRTAAPLGSGEATAGPGEALDSRLALGFLRTQLWEYRSTHFHRGNPSTHTGEAVFALLSLFLADYAPLAERMDAARERLAALPSFLARAAELISSAPTEWTRRAMRECDGGLAFLGGGLRRVPGVDGLWDAGLDALVTQARDAFGAYRAHLETTVLDRPAGHYGAGAEAFALHLREAHGVETPAEEVARYAEEELEQADARLVGCAAELGASGPAEALARLTALHPTVDGYYERYTKEWEEVRAAVEEAGLLTWPDFPIRFVARPGWARAAAPFLYFLFYRSPAAFGRPAVHEYLVEPVEPEMPPDEQDRLLAATNDSVIRLNHVMHHGGVGHHVQNWHAFRAESRIGRVAAVDCASRIAMLCGGTMAEGWACYATDLMEEIGLLTPLERCAQLRGRTRMCARAVVDVRLHSGEYTLEDAARYYRERGGMSEGAALAEAVKNSMFPGGAVMYLLGRDGIVELRREAAARAGDAFDLRSFHDELLAHGSIPVRLIRDSMMDEPDDR